MKKVFFDCGSHHGMALKFYRKIMNMGNDWEIHAFEPNPSNREFFQKGGVGYSENVVFHEEAIADIDGEISFFMEDHSISRSGSPVLSNVKTDGWGSTTSLTSRHRGLSAPITVKAVDLSRLLERYNEKDFIVVKMDIEGSEYKVLRKMISKGTIKKISLLFVEFHYHNHVPEENLESTQELISQIELLGVPVILESFDMERMGKIIG